jgi:quercetin dioxygenase-like cupin family protein
MSQQQAKRTDQEPRPGKRIFRVHAADVPVEKLEKKGAEKVQVQYLIDDRHGSDRFALRLYTVQKGGHTPLDEHPYEHQVYVLSGQGLLRESKGPDAPLKTVKAKDVFFIPSNAVHQFSNVHDEPFVFLCVKGNPQLYQSPQLSTAAADSQQNYC